MKFWLSSMLDRESGFCLTHSNTGVRTSRILRTIYHWFTIKNCNITSEMRGWHWDDWFLRESWSLEQKMRTERHRKALLRRNLKLLNSPKAKVSSTQFRRTSVMWSVTFHSRVSILHDAKQNSTKSSWQEWGWLVSFKFKSASEWAECVLRTQWAVWHNDTNSSNPKTNICISLEELPLE